MSRSLAMILAAGEGRRMGGPKTRLRLDGQSLLGHHVALLESVGCAPIVVVVRPEEVAAAPATAIVVPVRTKTPAESLAAGLRALVGAVPNLADDDRLVLGPIDMLPAMPKTLLALLHASGSAPEVDAVTPSHAGKSGHPIVVRVRLVAPYLEQNVGAERLRDVVRRSRRLSVEVSDPAVLGDFDVQEDFARHRERLSFAPK